MNKVIGNVEDFIWNNLRFYLLTYQTCLLDLLLTVKDPEATKPFDRYKDFMNDLGRHMGLGSYVNVQSTQFSEIPYITVNISAIPMTGCSTRAVVGFDVVFTTDVPKAPKGNSTRYVGNSNESVAQFRAEVADALCQLFYRAYPEQTDDTFYDVPFWEAFYDKEVKNPSNPDETRLWNYNIKGQVDSEYTISEVTQLKREDRSSGLSVFTVVFTLDINHLSGDGIDCGC